jgi:hyperosmotically inducible protein
VTAKVQAQFFADDDVKARYIDVSSRDGVVTLKGFVENDTVRHEAVRIAQNTDGVARVNDELLLGQAPQTASAASTPGTVSPAPLPETVGTTGTSAAALDDATVTSLVQAKYFLDPSIKQRSIDVSTSTGIVTLRGQVASDTERAQALLLARTTLGVERVEDSLTIDASLTQPAASGSTAGAPLPSASIPGAGTAAPAAQPQAAGSAKTADGGRKEAGTSGVRPADTGIESALRSKLTREASLKGIEVSARDGVVLLQGSVANQAAKERALTLARGTEGVMQVVDRLSVGRQR